MVIDALSSRLLSLSNGQRQGADLACEAAVLAEEVGQPVAWYRYNDSRLDGVLSASQWQSIYPNAEELERQSLRGERLDTLLDRWAVGRGQGSRPPINLTLRQGDPLAALAGMGSWERLLQRIELASPNAEQLWGAAVDAWAESREFERVQDQPLVWSRDLLGRCRQDCEELIAERADLQKRVSELEARLSQVNQELGEMIAALHSGGMISEAED